MSDSLGHDDMLFEMLKSCKTLPSFLDQVFGFLQRRTDFYHVPKESNDIIGLPEGLAEKLVHHTFSKWKPRPKTTICRGSDIPAVTETTIVDVTDEVVDSNEKSMSQQSRKLAEVKISEDLPFNKSECYNGAVYENYCWSQTINEVDIIIKVPEGLSKKDVEVKILCERLSVKLKDGTDLLTGDLCQKCKANDALWSLDKQKLEMHLEKSNEMWWNCLVKDEPTLDISKIDCTRPYEDLPEETQAKLEELTWNQERKRLGLPTSDEMAMQQTLEKAWKAEGSPFSGPFDPTTVHIG